MQRAFKAAVVRQHEIFVTMENPDDTAISVAVHAPSGETTNEMVDISALLNAGMSTDDALQMCLKAVSVGVEGFKVGNG